MIVSENKKSRLHEFEDILKKAHNSIEKECKSNSYYFLNRTASQFESDVYDFLCQAAKKTVFENTIQLISGHKFPDIVVKELYGVEVKTTKQNHWKSTGNSVLETTRVENVSNIFIYFAKLSDPIGFKYKPYHECLYDIAVTHSPRYLIDMDIERNNTIFTKLEIEYDDLRALANPVKPFVDYYRKNTKPGEEPWWMEDSNNVLKPTIRIFSNLEKEEKKSLKVEAMALFPEIFGNDSTKYQRVAGWLASRYGIVDSSLRDRFTAGGRENLVIANNSYPEIPRIFVNLYNNIDQVINNIECRSIDDLRYYWNFEALSEMDNKIDVWISLVKNYVGEIYSDGVKFVINIIGDYLGKRKTNYINDEYDKYGL